MRGLLKESNTVAMSGMAMVEERLDRVARPRTAIAGQATARGARSSATQTTMARHDRSTTAGKPAAFAGCQQRLQKLKSMMMATVMAVMWMMAHTVSRRRRHLPSAGLTSIQQGTARKFIRPSIHYYYYYY